MSHLALSGKGDTLHIPQVPRQLHGSVFLLQLYLKSPDFVPKGLKISEAPAATAKPESLSGGIRFIDGLEGVCIVSLIDALESLCGYSVSTITCHRTSPKNETVNGTDQNKRLRIRLALTRGLKDPSIWGHHQKSFESLLRRTWTVSAYDNGEGAKMPFSINLKGHGFERPQHLLQAGGNSIDLTRI